MTAEELLKLLDERGLADEEKVAILKEALDTVAPSGDQVPADLNPEEQKEAGKLLGVDL